MFCFWVTVYNTSLTHTFLQIDRLLGLLNWGTKPSWFTFYLKISQKWCPDPQNCYLCNLRGYKIICCVILGVKYGSIVWMENLVQLYSLFIWTKWSNTPSIFKKLLFKQFTIVSCSEDNPLSKTILRYLSD